MNDETSPRALTGEAAARTLGSTLIAALALIAVLGVIDRGRTKSLEHFEESTAVGDSRVIELGADGKPAVVLPKLNGQPLAPDGGRVEVRDTKMERVARDEASGFTIYRQREGKEHDYFLKVAPNAFLKVRPAK